MNVLGYDNQLYNLDLDGEDINIQKGTINELSSESINDVAFINNVAIADYLASGGIDGQDSFPNKIDATIHVKAPLIEASTIIKTKDALLEDILPDLDFNTTSTTSRIQFFQNAVLKSSIINDTTGLNLNSSQINLNNVVNFPKYTTTQRDAIVPTLSMVIYNTTTTQFEYYNGVSWVPLSSPPFNYGANINLTSTQDFSTTTIDLTSANPSTLNLAGSLTVQKRLQMGGDLYLQGGYNAAGEGTGDSPSIFMVSNDVISDTANLIMTNEAKSNGWRMRYNRATNQFEMITKDSSVETLRDAVNLSTGVRTLNCGGTLFTTLLGGSHAYCFGENENNTLKLASGDLLLRRAGINILIHDDIAYTLNTALGIVLKATNDNIRFSMKNDGAILSKTPFSSNPASASCIWEVRSTAQGSIAFPKMTTTQRDAIVTPTEGLWIFNTVTHRPNFFDGTIWQTL